MKGIRNCRGNETLIFAKTFEQEAYDQTKKLINFSAYQSSKVRIMPDAHAGKGCLVGTTMTITDKITPNLVGVDIGCGMLTIKLKDKVTDFAMLDRIIAESVPSGFNVHNKSQARFDFRLLTKGCRKKADVVRASKSIGTLGGGNHFIELSESIHDGSQYLVIHSGSRKLGGDTCKYHQNKAIDNINDTSGIKQSVIDKLKSEGRSSDIQKELKKIKIPTSHKDLAYLTGSDFKDYMNDMKYVQEYASLNRTVMADIILTKMGLSEESRFETIHNYIDFSRMILRKGAVSAEKGEVLLIPINMKDGSLICIGKGNPEWNYSAPHGAGRLMSRSKAKELIDLEEFEESMKGVYSTSVGRSTLDEAPMAYKSMDEIKGAITDTVDIIDELRPLYNYKSH